ncbi:hypothetical protein GPJ56_000152 [Histomonas meleagridis]|uniref:uncharacterized protein n=1 Tax=Histomonas meleagridis TaxID=135588 RepID=UPI003559D5D0|nr:hypothetical protein GPJ56_000152 [Histomonas meleagridis]KAH0806566.1 hypothetical protein GO595_000728 [Histomonas meleagridis]
MDAWNALGPSSWGPPIHVYRIIPTDIEAKLSLFQKVDYIPQYSPMKRFVTPRLNEMLGIPDVGEDVLQQIPNHRPFV